MDFLMVNASFRGEMGRFPPSVEVDLSVELELRAGKTGTLCRRLFTLMLQLPGPVKGFLKRRSAPLFCAFQREVGLWACVVFPMKALEKGRPPSHPVEILKAFTPALRCEASTIVEGTQDCVTRRRRKEDWRSWSFS
jgi:hypothetical protein